MNKLVCSLILINISLFNTVKADELQKELEKDKYQEKVSFQFQSISIVDLFNAISTLLEVDIIMDVIDRDIYIKADDITLAQALNDIAKIAKLNIEYRENKIFIIEKNPTQEESFTAINVNENLEINENNNQEIKKDLTIETIGLNYALSSYVIDKVNSMDLDILSDIQMLEEDNKNELIVIGNSASVKTIKDIVSSLDKRAPHVNISARIVVVRSDIAEALGVRWGGKINGRNISITGGTEGTPDNDTFVNLGNAPMIDFGLNGVGSSNFTFGVPTSSNTYLDFELSLLKSQGKVEILSQPSIRSVSGQLAFISSGVEIPYQVQSRGYYRISTSDY